MTSFTIVKETDNAVLISYKNRGGDGNRFAVKVKSEGQKINSRRYSNMIDALTDFNACKNKALFGYERDNAIIELNHK